jgi:cobalt-zinc-cadmium efflux system outer membrane protein
MHLNAIVVGQEVPKLNPAKSYSLEELLTFVREFSPEVLATKAEIDAARGELITAGLLPNPKVEFTGRNQQIPDEDLSGFNYDVSISQEIPLGGKIGHRKRIAQLNLEKANLDFENVLRLKTAEIKKAFYAVLFNQKRQELAKEALEVNKTILDIANKRYKAGDIPLLGVNLASAELQKTTAESITLQGELNQANLELLNVLGMGIDSSSLKVTGTLSKEPARFNLSELVIFASANRPDYKGFQVALKRADAEIALAKAGGVPDIEIGGNFEKELGSEKRAGGFVSIPLPLFNRNQGEVAKALSRKNQATLELAALKNKIEQEVRISFARMEASKKRLDVFQQGLVDLVRENLELNRKAFQAGEIEFLEVVRAQEEFIRTNTLFLEALYAYNLALVELETVLGKPFTGASKGKEEKK